MRDIWSERLLSFCCFHFQTQTKHLAPGKYDLGSFTKDLNSECWTMNIIIMLGCHYMLVVSADCHRKKHGRFGTVPQHPTQPTERIYCSTLSQCPRRKVQAVSFTILQASFSCFIHACTHTHTHTHAHTHTYTYTHTHTHTYTHTHTHTNPQEDPGPGCYELRPQRTKSAPSRFPFNSSAKTQTLFNGSTVRTVIVGRIDA